MAVETNIRYVFVVAVVYIYSVHIESSALETVLCSFTFLHLVNINILNILVNIW